MVSLPLWALFTIGFGAPLLAFLGVVAAQVIARRGAAELETRSRREETMRNVRWAAELSVSTNERLVDLGVAQLAALLESDLLADREKIFVEAALDTVYSAPEAELEELGDGAEVVELKPREVSDRLDELEGEVSSSPTGDDGGDDHE